jgi:lambda family phage portal protein
MAKRSLTERVLNRFGAISRRQVAGLSKRAYSFAAVNRLTADWITSGLSGNAELRGPVRRIIHRARDLAHENDYVRGFLVDVENNVIGAAEFDLRMDVGEMQGDGVKRPDALANRLIESAWWEWVQPSTCTVNGDMDWRGVKRLALRDVPTAGAVLVRHIRGAAAGNRFGYAVQLLEIEQLDLDKHENTKDGGRIRFGIEKNATGRTVAYHVLKQHPGDDIHAGMVRRDVERIPAADMILLQLPERISQVLSQTWMISSGKSLKMLDGYEDAELVAARAGACKGGWFKTPVDGGPGYPTGRDGEQFTMDAEPGMWEALPPGVEPVVNDPSHPNSQFGEFRKAVLRRVATSLGISYTTLGNDLEAVNFSSARVGLMDEREVWKALQLWFRVHFLEVVFREWLTMALSVGAINLPLAKFDKFNQPRFKTRRWEWLDPLKEAQAKALAVEKGFTSRRAIIDEQGGDIEVVFADLEADAKLATKHGISFAATGTTPTRPMPKPDEDEGAD